ncbi:hypothetical protein [Bradyrhizobium diazoefficiens]
MTREQRRLAETMRSTTLEFAALARSREEFGGGMQWLKVKKFEYLTRYRRDPLTGEQKAASIGRRSPETEGIYERFIKERAELDRQIAALRRDNRRADQNGAGAAAHPRPGGSRRCGARHRHVRTDRPRHHHR